MVSTNGGRYDVNVGQRSRTPVYWDTAPVAVRRCSWFYKREGDNRYIPYEEDFAARLEVTIYTYQLSPLLLIDCLGQNNTDFCEV